MSPNESPTKRTTSRGKRRDADRAKPPIRTGPGLRRDDGVGAGRTSPRPRSRIRDAMRGRLPRPATALLGACVARPGAPAQRLPGVPAPLQRSRPELDDSRPGRADRSEFPATRAGPAGRPHPPAPLLPRAATGVIPSPCEREVSAPASWQTGDGRCPRIPRSIFAQGTARPPPRRPARVWSRRVQAVSGVTPCTHFYLAIRAAGHDLAASR